MQFLSLLLCVLSGSACVLAAMKPLDKTECVEWHNYYRKIHQAPDIKWSNALEADAQTWANYLASNDKFEHAKNRNGQGENLYRSSGDSDHSCRDATTLFYKEEPYYNYDGKYVAAAGHFTQVVWVGSTEIGVGKAKTTSGATILVFRYKPAGNVIGYFGQNVLPPIGEALTHRPSFWYTLVFSLIAAVIAAQQSF